MASDETESGDEMPIEQRLPRAREMQEQWENGEIDDETMAGEFPLGWFDCPDCEWQGPSAPLDFEDYKVRCPECDHPFDELGGGADGEPN